MHVKKERLIKQLKKKNSKGVEEFIQLYGNRLFGYVLRLTGDYHHAEDLYQEVIIKIVDKIHTYDKRHPFESWIIVVARNHVYDFMKKKKVIQLPIESCFGEKSKDDTPEETMLSKENSHELERKISKLSSEQQSVIRLKYFGCLSYSEIAEAMNIPVKKVKWLLYDARQKLLTLLEEDEYYAL